MELTADVPGFGVGAGGGGGIEIPVARTGRLQLAVAPAIHVGWAGTLVLQAGVGLRMGVLPR